MRPEIETDDEFSAWLASPHPVILQGLDLVERDEELAQALPSGCTFIGCRVGPRTAEAAIAHGSLVVPVDHTLPFRPFRTGLYGPHDLYDAVGRDGELDYRACVDRRVYEWYADPTSRRPRPADLEATVMRRLHDTSISDSLEDLLDAPTRARCVAIMGGHDVARTDPLFRSVAVLARELVDAGFIVLTGGGPGLMEAANLGAYTSGFRVPDVALNAVLTEIAPSPRYDSPGWIESAHRAWRRLGPPADPLRAMSIGIPTWFYGHEPPNLFATHIAKYFENSVREEGLLALAGGGVIFAEGNGGTVQEMFQDACQNYYRVYDGRQSPMVVLGVDYWNPTGPPAGKRKPAWPLLHQLATEKGFLDKLLLTDDHAAIVPFLQRRSRV